MCFCVFMLRMQVRLVCILYDDFFFYSVMFHCVAGRVLLIDVMAKAIARNNSKNFINIILNEIYTRKLSSAVCRVDHH